MKGKGRWRGKEGGARREGNRGEWEMEGEERRKRRKLETGLIVTA